MKQLYYSLHVLALACFSIPITAGEIPQPRSIRSVNRVLTDTLNLRESTVTADNRTFTAATYSGVVPGSIWRALPGDTLRIRLNNLLPPNTDKDSVDQGNFPQRVNTTNLHTHGLNVTPKDNGDNVLLSILPGDSFDFEFVLPQHHAAGTYWYHPHHHTSTYYQVASSLAGTIVVEDPNNPAITDPALRQYEDRVLMFSMFLIDTTTNAVAKPRRLSAATAFSPMVGYETPVLINGVYDGTMTMRPGEIQRWRMINATYEPMVSLRWLRIDGTDTTAVPQHEIAVDGLYYPSAKTVDTVMIPTGARSDVLVTAPTGAGRYVVEFSTLNYSLEETAVRMAIEIVVAGEPVVPAMQLPTRLPEAIAKGSIKDEEITGSRELVFAIEPPKDISADPTAVSRMFMINSAPFNHEVVNISVKIGDVEEWTINNTSDGYHPFHIHVNEFQVTEINGMAVNPPIWRDVLLLAPNSTYKIRHRFSDFDGKTVLHCHFLPHEDWGMMNMIEILPRTSSVNERPWEEPLAFPNPAVGRYSQISVRVPDFLTSNELIATLHDISGNEIARNVVAGGAGKTVFNVADAPAGTYYVRLTDGVRFSNTDMIVLVR